MMAEKMETDACSNPKQIEDDTFVGKIRFNNPGKLLSYLVGGLLLGLTKRWQMDRHCRDG